MLSYRANRSQRTTDHLSNVIAFLFILSVGGFAFFVGFAFVHFAVKYW